MGDVNGVVGFLFWGCCLWGGVEAVVSCWRYHLLLLGCGDVFYLVFLNFLGICCCLFCCCFCLGVFFLFFFSYCCCCFMFYLCFICFYCCFFISFPYNSLTLCF